MVKNQKARMNRSRLSIGKAKDGWKSSSEHCLSMAFKWVERKVLEQE